MSKRPLSIAVISWIFIAAGVVGLAYHANEFITRRPFKYELLWVCFVRLLAILAGVFILRGNTWARWLLVLWLAYHVGLSLLHTPFELVVHSLLFVALLYFLFRAPASAYFSRDNTR
jgi:uncharacterized membrane protein HdeD (DUF308 family)